MQPSALLEEQSVQELQTKPEIMGMKFKVRGERKTGEVQVTITITRNDADKRRNLLRAGA